jgi:hypothetical protein
VQELLQRLDFEYVVEPVERAAEGELDLVALCRDEVFHRTVSGDADADVDLRAIAHVLFLPDACPLSKRYGPLR